MSHWMVFTDLDGTLLDHHDYSYQAALPAINLLKQQGIPIILNSSKTLAELATVSAAIELNDPVIAENGSLIDIPGEPPVLWGPDYVGICQLLDQLRDAHQWQFQGFHDWSAEEVAEQTGLSVDAASLAAKRQASEPLVWSDSEDNLVAFKEALDAAGLQLKRGGRFWHVMGQTDKVNAMTFLAERYRQQHDSSVKLIALGDGPNDIGMLEAANVAVIVHNPESHEISVSQRDGQQVIKTTLAGPAGWNAAIQQILNL